MNKKLLRSVVALVATLAIGGGTTYALFTSGPVTITSNSLTTGEAALKICDSTAGGADLWDTTMNPSFSLNSLVPGGSSQALTESTVYLGNDSGDLENNLGGECAAYNGLIESSSDVNMKVVPSITTLSCPTSTDLDDQLELEFVIGGMSTNFQSLTAWTSNTTQYGPTINPDQTATVVMNARLTSAATEQNETCTFTASFIGEQV